MKHIKDVLKAAVPQRWSAVDLANDINLDPKGKHTVKVTTLSGMLKHAVQIGDLVVKRELVNDRMAVWYEGPADVFKRIRDRINSGP